MLKSKIAFSNMQANTQSGSSQVGEDVDKARKIFRKRSSEWGGDMAVELQPASLVQPIWQYSRSSNPVHPSGSALRSQEQDFDLPTTVIENLAFLQSTE